MDRKLNYYPDPDSFTHFYNNITINIIILVVTCNNRFLLEFRIIVLINLQINWIIEFEKSINNR